MSSREHQSTQFGRTGQHRRFVVGNPDWTYRLGTRSRRQLRHRLTCLLYRNFYLLHLVSAVSLFLVLTGMMVAWRQLAAVRGGRDEGGSPRDRSWFMAWLGILMSSIFALTIVALAVTKFVLSPCD